MATEDEEATIDAFHERVRTEGNWVFAGGLASPYTATVVDARDGEAVFTDGPYLSPRSTLPVSGHRGTGPRRRVAARVSGFEVLQPEG